MAAHALQCQHLSFLSLSDSFCTRNTNYRRVEDDQRGVINCLTSLILYFSRCTEGCTDFYSPHLFTKILVIHPRVLIGLRSPILGPHWPVIPASPRSCFLISNLDCSERAAYRCRYASQYLREYYLWRSKHPPPVGGNCFLPLGSQPGAGLTNGNGERLNFPALSGSRRVAGSKVNSLPFWTRLMFLLWRCRVSPEIAIKSFSEHKYTQLSRAPHLTPHPYHS